MGKYKINEIFYSLQGEGLRAGTANIFVRFANCNLTCNFCDTEFESSTELTLNELMSELAEHPCKNVILTGGEPLLQYDKDLSDALVSAGYFICCETNGSVKVTDGTHIDYIVCSPKVAEHVVKQNFKNGVQELKYVRHVGQAIPQPQVSADCFYLSPQATGNQIGRENLKHCIDLVKANPQWRLTLQNHKIWQVR